MWISNPLTLEVAILRIVIIIVCSGLIGYERERHNSHAGVKTHMIVGIASGLLTMTQLMISQDLIHFIMLNPSMANASKTDPTRIIAQIVSGIGFLGAGTIVVTKRSVSGLTTAASIWATAAIGITIGMGYYEIGVVAFVAMFFILTVIKKIQALNFTERLIIEYLNGPGTSGEIKDILDEIKVGYKLVDLEIKYYGNERVFVGTYEISSAKNYDFESFVNVLSTNHNIVSIHSTNL